MTIEEAKAILSVWRPDGSDSSDQDFREALEFARHNPELLEWLHRQQEFDQDLTDSMNAIRGPANGRQEILAQAPVILRRRTVMRRFRWMVAAAALFVACAVGWQQFMLFDRVLPSRTIDLAGAAEHLSLHHKEMEILSNDTGDLLSWLSHRQSPFPRNVPTTIQELKAYGAQDWNTRRGRVSLICFYVTVPERNRDYAETDEWIHFFTFAGDLAQLPGSDATPRLVEGREWVFIVWRDSGQAYALGLPARTGAREKLQALVGA